MLKYALISYLKSYNLDSNTKMISAELIKIVTIKDYIKLAKPGIISSNMITTMAGFFVASSVVGVDLLYLMYTLLGIGLIIACGCVMNNYFDQDIDKIMTRTQSRFLVKQRISPTIIFIYASILGILGSALLYLLPKLTALYSAWFGLFVYVVVYTLMFKRSSVHGTLVGSVSGAIPPVVGYVAVSGFIDLGAIILFTILFIWQMPHFYAIGIYRLKDYKDAGVPILPVIKGVFYTKIQMFIYSILLLIPCILLYVLGYAGLLYLVVAVISCSYWSYLCFKGFTTKDDISWAKKVFGISILTIILLSLSMSIYII